MKFQKGQEVMVFYFSHTQGKYAVQKDKIKTITKQKQEIKLQETLVTFNSDGIYSEDFYILPLEEAEERMKIFVEVNNTNTMLSYIGKIRIDPNLYLSDKEKYEKIYNKLVELMELLR